MKRWEYLVVRIPDANWESFEGEMDDHGSRGWELCCLDSEERYVFKREVPVAEAVTNVIALHRAPLRAVPDARVN